MNHFRWMMAAAVASVLTASGAAFAAGDHEGHLHDYDHSPEAEDFVHGVPELPTDLWTMAAGGRIYDNWWNALDRSEPETTNPAYPATGQQEGSATWRCKECHGWDYLGAAGIYSGGSHFTGIPGIKGGEGKTVDELMVTLRDANHPYSQDMISDDEMARAALFVSKGQVDMAAYVNLETRQMKAGFPERGREIFQTICAACHGFDGRAIDWGEGDEHNYVGTEASSLADEVLHKVLNAHPGVAMINLRAFSIEDAVNLMSYAATLPVE